MIEHANVINERHLSKSFLAGAKGLLGSLAFGNVLRKDQAVFLVFVGEEVGGDFNRKERTVLAAVDAFPGESLRPP